MRVESCKFAPNANGDNSGANGDKSDANGDKSDANRDKFCKGIKVINVRNELKEFKG